MLPYLDVRDCQGSRPFKKATETLQVLDHMTTVAYQTSSLLCNAQDLLIPC